MQARCHGDKVATLPPKVVAVTHEIATAVAPLLAKRGRRRSELGATSLERAGVKGSERPSMP
jgi:hypothetical protein